MGGRREIQPLNGLRRDSSTVRVRGARPQTPARPGTNLFQCLPARGGRFAYFTQLSPSEKLEGPTLSGWVANHSLTGPYRSSNDDPGAPRARDSHH